MLHSLWVPGHLGRCGDDAGLQTSGPTSTPSHAGWEQGRCIPHAYSLAEIPCPEVAHVPEAQRLERVRPARAPAQRCPCGPPGSGWGQWGLGSCKDEPEPALFLTTCSLADQHVCFLWAKSSRSMCAQTQAHGSGWGAGHAGAPCTAQSRIQASPPRPYQHGAWAWLAVPLKGQLCCLWAPGEPAARTEPWKGRVNAGLGHTRASWARGAGALQGERTAQRLPQHPRQLGKSRPIEGRDQCGSRAGLHFPSTCHANETATN